MDEDSFKDLLRTMDQPKYSNSGYTRLRYGNKDKKCACSGLLGCDYEGFTHDGIEMQFEVTSHNNGKVDFMLVLEFMAITGELTKECIEDLTEAGHQPRREVDVYHGIGYANDGDGTNVEFRHFYEQKRFVYTVERVSIPFEHPRRKKANGDDN